MIKHFFAAAKKDSTLHLEIYGRIGETYDGEGITAKTVSAAIKAAGEFSDVSMRINSPGGNSFEGVAIYNLLRAQNKPINTSVDGVAASAASVIAMAADRIVMGQGAMMMIHNVWTIVAGNAKAFRQVADAMDKASGSLAEVYAAKTGKPLDEIQAMMDAETWMNADDAVSSGFADEVVKRSAEEQKQARALAASFRMKFAKAPAFEESEPEEPEPEAKPESTESDWQGQLDVYRKRLALAR